MKFQTHNEIDVDILFTGLQGYIQASLDELIRAFGPYSVESRDVPAAWYLKFEDGTVATVYWWPSRGPLNVRESSTPVTWQIGGRSKAVQQLVHDAFRERLGFAARAAA